ncbi:hypothetical protein TNCV_3416291 [Trichonephila clavipes]|nr:hypothetical protein TNCV_3416291 [Trichonephila clavipes]
MALSDYLPQINLGVQGGTWECGGPQKPILKILKPKCECHIFVDASLTDVRALLKQPDSSGCGNPPGFHPGQQD